MTDRQIVADVVAELAKNENAVNSNNKRFMGLLTAVIFVGFLANASVGILLSISLKVKPEDVLASQLEQFDEVNRELKILREAVGISRARSDQVAAAYDRSLEHSRDAYIVLDDRGLIRAWSDGASLMFGVKREDAIGYGPGFLIPQVSRGDHSHKFSSRVENNVEFSQVVNCSAIHSDGRLIPVTIRTRVVPEYGAIAHFTLREES